jgi:serine/threonine protein kinase
MSDEQGSRVGTMFGPYRLKRLLGKGGMGEVYEAEHTVKEWTVALKVMNDQFSKDPVFRERMKREARTAGKLMEPHVVPIHEYGEIDGQMFMEMRLIEGTDLDSILQRFGPLTPPRAVAIITQIASALDAAHAAGVMHRDVKPPNIIVTRDDFAYLVDFGIASATTDEKLTQLGTAVGTWKYMAPERFSNAEVTYRADIYALTCVLHEALTGAPPYRADSASVLVTAHLMDAVPQPSTIRSGIPKALDAVIARGMAKKPEDRYASCGDLALAATEALSDPDQNHFQTILRRSQETAMPASFTNPVANPVSNPVTSKPPPPPTMVGGDALPPPAPSMPRANTPPPGSGPYAQPRYPDTSGSGPGSGSTPPPTGRGWAADSGPVPTPNQQVPQSQQVPQYYQGGGGGSNWGGPPPAQPPPQQPVGSAPWNQPPNQPQPPRKRNPWPIVAAVAAVVLVVIIAVAVIIVVNQKEPVKVAKPIPSDPDRLAALLLSSSEANAVMGATNMTAGKPITAMETSSSTITPSNCLGVLYTSQSTVYGGTGYTGISGVVYSENGDNFDHWLNEGVVVFPTADKAKAFQQTALDNWKSCAGKTVTVTNNKGKTYRWTFTQVTGGPPKMVMTDTQEGADGWACQRAMSQANNVIVDINACSYHTAEQASTVADKIVEKINSQQ